MEKFKKVFSSHPILWTLLFLVIVAAIGLLIWFAPAFSLKASDIPVKNIPVTELGEVIVVEDNYKFNGANKRKSQEVVIAQNGGRTLTLETKEMIFTLTDDATGLTWSTALPGTEKSTDASKFEDKSLLILEYFGEDNTDYKLNSYEGCVNLNNVTLTPMVDEQTGVTTSVNRYSFLDTITRIENGVQLKMLIKDNTKEYFAYMPQILSKESYDFFVQRIKELREEGVNMDQLEKAFNTYYDRADPSDPSKYPLGGGGTPSISGVNQLIELAEKVGYTRDMLLKDCERYNLVPASTELAEFVVTLEITLENGELVARVPSNQIVNNNDYFKLSRIHVLPNFGATYGATAQGGTTTVNAGYFLVPDGAGALIRHSSSDGTLGSYERAFMNNDFFQDYYWQSEYGQELMMPVFGIMYGEEVTHGVLAIIESGSETANLHVNIAQPTAAGENKAYASVDTTEFAKVRIYGPYADNTAEYRADSGMIMTDFVVRYIPYAEPVNYFDMAMDYRDFIAEESGKAIETPEGPALYLEVMGAVTLTDRFAGIPYDNITSMTTYEELAKIISALPEGTTVQYDGVFNGGILSELNNGARLVDENGSEDELAQMQKAAAKNGVQLFYQLNLSRVYDNGRNYIPSMHAARDYSNEAMTIYLYRPDNGQMNGRWDPIREYTIPSPRYFTYLADCFKEEQNDSKLLKGADLAIGDLACDVFADYRYNKVIDPVEARDIVRITLSKLAADGSVLALNNPFADVAAQGKYAVNVSRESSNYASFYATVPFRQLALSGLTNVVGVDANLNSRSQDFYLMQAAELGMSIKYTVAWESSDLLKNSHFESMYAICWEDWKNDVISAANTCATLRTHIGGRAIVNHVMLQPQVFETTYDGDVRVITNYSALPYESTEGTVEPGGYLLIPAAQEGGAP